MEAGLAELILPEIVVGFRVPATISGRISSATPTSVSAAVLIVVHRNAYFV